MKEFISMSTLGTFGKFGNQLFQYAALKTYAKKNNLDPEVPSDWVGRKIFADCHDSPISDAPRERRDLAGDCIWTNGDKLNGCDIKGYCQYHTSVYDKEYFRSLFRIMPALEKGLKEPVKHIRGLGKTVVGIHIRLGDYRVLGRSANIAPTGWYLRWLKENWDKLDDPVLFIASDEIDTVINDFKDYKPNAFPGDNFLCDHYVLQNCDVLLISNSTFSFTAAMLNVRYGDAPTDKCEPAIWCFRPDFQQKGLVTFDPWDADPKGAVFPVDEPKADCVPLEGPIKLHLGCGGIHKDGYVNMDCIKTPAVDVMGDIRQLPYQNDSVGIIECYHTLEHLPVCLQAFVNSDFGEKYADLIAVLKEWNRVLKRDGQLVIEMPDFDTVVEDYLTADETRKEELLLSIFGSFRNNNEMDYHRWGANPYRLRYILEKAGFRNIEFKKPQDYHVATSPCLRVEAIK